MTVSLELIEQLAAAAKDARAALREAHEARKDLRAAAVEAREILAECAAERERLADAVRAAVQAEVEQAVEAELVKMADVVRKGIADAEAGVYRRFDTITNLLLTGNPKGQRGHKADLEGLAEAAAAARSERGPVDWLLDLPPGAHR